MVIEEGLLAGGLHRGRSREDDGVGGHLKWDLVDDDEAKGLARYVDALPKAHRGHENGVPRASETVEERSFGRLALHEHGPSRNSVERGIQGVHGALRRAKDERAAPARVDELVDARFRGV